MDHLSQESTLKIVEIQNESYIMISQYDSLRPFLMNIASDSNHWLFVSSNGGITMGRKNAEYAIFPYYTDDKLAELTESTGSKTIFQIHQEDKVIIWEPFRARYSSKYKIQRNIYKNFQGNKIIFEEHNLDLNLSFQYQWNTSQKYGFIKKCKLINHSDKDLKICILDGIQNILPYGISSDLQRSVSNLGDAYKRNELDKNTGMGIYSLSAMIVDKAEPSEALKANIAWSLGMKNPTHLLTSCQLNHFRMGKKPQAEFDKKGMRGAYFLVEEALLKTSEAKEWKIITDVNQSYSNIVAIGQAILHDPQLDAKIEQDIAQGTSNLTQMVASADGLQCTADTYTDFRHYSNVLFNILRGGIFDDNYFIEKKDFLKYLEKANKEIVKRQRHFLNGLEDKINRFQLKEAVNNLNDPDLKRLTIEYLPLKFSRRHGDPSRPWNYFNINTIDPETGEKILDYEGNWRDLFQNWEALAHSYPEYIDGMIFKFVNASTFDGYNPYRLMKEGFDWETIEPDNPWSYIGYWGDHQVIYLLKFFEIAESYFPNALVKYLEDEVFVYAAVPYIIKPYEDLLNDSHNTIEFDFKWDKNIRDRRNLMGFDGALLQSGDNEIYKVNLLEKILAMVLSKLSNFVPEAGIWMNTQRPEWNDANNALVGNGASMVTLYYLRRFMKHFQMLLEHSTADRIRISSEIREFYHSIRDCFDKNQGLLSSSISDKDRKSILDQLGLAASDYRKQIYKNGFWGKKATISRSGLLRFVDLSLKFIDHSIKANKRKDKLYHAYNIISLNDSEGISISHLNEMLEGQVAVLSSGFLSPKEAAEILNALRRSALYREDQNSYILYPNVDLPGFLNKNIIPKASVVSSELLDWMLADNNTSIIEMDKLGQYHFNGKFRNSKDLAAAIDQLPEKYQEVARKEKDILMKTFDQVFNHKSFTGRSGTFFAYEGLGSIYWHMVSKLLLATQENYFQALAKKDDESAMAIQQHYIQIKEGLGVHKSPQLYGAFPTDAYSHTPMHKGAQQPGMTGQVKEDIIVRLHEMGIHIHEGSISIIPKLLQKELFLQKESQFNFFNLEGELLHIHAKPNTLHFTYNQVHVVYELGEKGQISIEYIDGNITNINTLQIDKTISSSIFKRLNLIETIKVQIPKSQLSQFPASIKIY